MLNHIGASKVITEHIRESNFRTYLVGFDINSTSGTREYRWRDLVNLLQATIPEFAFGLHEGPNVPQEELVHRLSEAARAIYKIDAFLEVADLTELQDDDPRKKYLSRGEFGELILHLLLRDFHSTIPLLSKIYFKDSYGSTVHGFDAVHIQQDSRTLWLGESKLYKAGKAGLKALIQDLKDHIKQDYLEAEFSIISKKIKSDDSIPEKDWLDSSGFTTKAGKQLSLSQIYRILMNPFYYGYFKYPQDGPLYKGLHQPIISKELFDNVRARIDDIVPEDKATWGSKKFPFKHLFYCGSCGSRLTVEEHFKPLKDGTKRRHVYYRCTKSTKNPDCKEPSIKADDITKQILQMVDAGEFDDIEPSEKLFKKIEQYKRVTTQLIKDHGIIATEQQHFKNYASYILRQGTLDEKDGFIRGLGTPLFAKDKLIHR